MSLKKTEQILYSINKKIHSRQLQQMKPAIDTTPPLSLCKQSKPYQLMSYNRRYQIKVDNQQMIDKILSIAKEDSSQKNNTVTKPPRGTGLEKWQRQKDNKKLYDRLIKVKPAIGSIEFWNRQYSRSTCARGKHTIQKKISTSSIKMALSVQALQEKTQRRYELQENQMTRERKIEKRLFKIRLPDLKLHHVKTQGNYSEQNNEAFNNNLGQV